MGHAENSFDINSAQKNVTHLIAFNPKFHR
jgi:hypothetical protein